MLAEVIQGQEREQQGEGEDWEKLPRIQLGLDRGAQQAAGIHGACVVRGAVAAPGSGGTRRGTARPGRSGVRVGEGGGGAAAGVLKA